MYRRSTLSAFPLGFLFLASVSSAATLTVTTATGDNAAAPPAGSLRERLNAAANNDVVVFASGLNGATIALVAPLLVSKSVSIDASALPGGITLSGRASTRIMTVFAGNTVTLTGLRIADGTASTGGGIQNEGTLTLQRVKVENCLATGGGNVACGGGICNGTGAVLTVNDSILRGNASNFIGGAIGSMDGSQITVTNSFIADNRSANSGGALTHRVVNVSGSMTLTNVTFTGNEGATDAASVGSAVGAVVSGAAGLTTTVQSCTFIGNPRGTATLVTNGALSVRNSLFWANAGNVLDVYVASPGTGTSLGGNLLSTVQGLTTATTDRIGINPRVSPLGDHGGPTPTFALLPGSVAINGGVAGGPATDQRGVARSGNADIGAFESRGFTFTLGGNNQRTLVSTAYAAPLTIDVVSAALEPVAGGVVTFTPPATGARLTTGTSTLTLDALGRVSLPVTANAIAGPFSVGVTSAGAAAATFSLTNLTSVALAPVSLAAGAVGSAYAATLTASGGTAPYTFAVSSGALPPGLALAAGGALTGTPTQGGSFNFTVTATDASSNAGPFSASRAYVVTISCPTITVGALPPAVAGVPWGATLSATPSGSYGWSVSAGVLPSELTLDALTGGLSGTFTTPGTRSFTTRATGFGACTGELAQALVVSCPACTIGGACVAAGAVDPANECLACNPAASATAYSPLAAGIACTDDGLGTTFDRCDGAGSCAHELRGTCFISGSSVLGGTPNPANECEECNPSLRLDGYTPRARNTACADDGVSCTADACDGAGSCTHVTSNACRIDGGCVAAGALDPANDCLACDPAASTSTYTARAEGLSCTDDGQVSTWDRCDGAGACQHEPRGTCLIGAASWLGGTANPMNACEECNPSLRQDGWSPRARHTACADDGLSCTVDACDGAGACTHTAQGACLVGGACVAAGTRDPANGCAACDPLQDSAAYSPRIEGVPCADDGVACTADRCDGAGACVHPPLEGVSCDGGTTPDAPRASGCGCVAFDGGEAMLLLALAGLWRRRVVPRSAR